MIRRPPSSTLFPYTPLSRSSACRSRQKIQGTPESADADVGRGRDRPSRGRQRRPSYQAKQSRRPALTARSEEHTSELQSQSNLVCRLLLEKKKKKRTNKRSN